jgi:hypothetical protein
MTTNPTTTIDAVGHNAEAALAALSLELDRARCVELGGATIDVWTSPLDVPVYLAKCEAVPLRNPNPFPRLHLFGWRRWGDR